MPFSPLLRCHHPLLTSILDWDSLESHVAFMESPAYQPFLKEVEKFIAATPKLFHIRLPPSQVSPENNPFAAPITECKVIFFDPGYPEQGYADRFSAFRDKTVQTPDVAVMGMAGAWSIEEQEEEMLNGVFDKGKPFVVFVGWPNVEASSGFKDVDGFRDVMGYPGEEWVGTKFWHVAFKEHR